MVRTGKRGASAEASPAKAQLNGTLAGTAMLAAAVLLVAAILSPSDSSANTPVGPVETQGTPGALWEAYNKTYDGQRYSPLAEINRANVATLKETCRVQIAQRGAFQAGPVVIDGTMFITNDTDTIALDPTTCAVKWRHSYKPKQREQWPVNRGVAYANGKVFRGTGDARLVAMDATTGELLWTNTVGDPDIGEYISGAPIAWNGLIFTGIAGSEFGIKGRIMAFDAATGREVWRFNTVPVDGEPGSETWQMKEGSAHGGGSWSSFALDPSTSEIFAPTGNPVPDFSPNERLGANLYTDAFVVLDARTGKLKWWYQLVPHDNHDRDLASAPMLYTNSDGRRVVAAAGKDGYLHVVDRDTHKLLFKTAVTTIKNEDKEPTPEGQYFCPGSAGGTLWNGPAHDRAAKTVYVGAVDWCMVIDSAPTKFQAGGNNAGGAWHPTDEKATGWITAVDSDTGAVRWRYHADSPVLAAVTVTAGGLVLTGDGEGNFLALDSSSGKLLHSFPTGGSMSGGVVTYQQGGKQYVAFTSGNVSRSTIFGIGGRPTLIVMELANRPVAAVRKGPDPERGAFVYRQMCTLCHGGDGANVAGFELKGLKERMTGEQIAEWLRNPAPPMPKVFPEPMDQQDQHDMEDLIAYLQKRF